MKDNIQLVGAYFKDLRDIRESGGGVEEGSNYGSLEKLLNGIGESLKRLVLYAGRDYILRLILCVRIMVQEATAHVVRPL